MSARIGSPAVLMLAALALGFALLPGCAKQKRGHGRKTKPPTQGGEPMQAELKGGTFIVDDMNDVRVMEATATRTVGAFQAGGDSNGPVTFTNVDAWMFKNGKKDARVQAPTAVWQDGQLRADRTAHVETADGKMKADAARALWADQVTTMWTTSALMFEKGQLKARLTAPEAYYKDDQLFCDKTAHAETPDGKMKLDSLKAVYHQPTAKLMLTTVTGRQYDAGKPVMQAQGPLAEFQNDVLVLPATGLARRLDDGSTISAKVVRWNRATGKIEATGDVRFNTPSARGVGQRFVGSSTLKQGTLTGRPRPRVFIRRQMAGGGRGKETRMQTRMGSRRTTAIAVVAGIGLTAGWFGSARPLAAAPPGPAKQPGAKPQPAKPLPNPPPPAAPPATPTPARLAPQPVQVPVPPPPDPSLDTIIEADKQSFDGATNRYTAVGNVDVQSPKAHMTADRMTVQMTETKEILWAKASGNVKLESKGEEGRTTTGTGEEGEYYEQEQKANLVGNVVLHFMSPSLTEPATITGARADVDLKTQQAVVTRAPGAPVKTIVRPKGKPGGSTAPMPESSPAQAQPGGAGAAAIPEPIELTSNRVEADGRANSFVATGGRPVMVQGTRRIEADKLWFNVDPNTNELQQARAIDDVVFDGIADDGGRLHATGDNGVYEGGTGVLTVTSNPGSQVVALQTPKDGDRPNQISGRVFTYDTRTKAHSIEGRARAVIPKATAPPPRTAAPRAGGGNR